MKLPRHAHKTPPAFAPGGQTDLNVERVMARLGVTPTDVALATSWSRTSVYRVMTNVWPTRADTAERAAFAELVRALLETRGATPDELDTLWQPAPPRRRRRPSTTDLSTLQDDEMLPQKEALAPQARKHFKLFTNPFDGEVTSDEMMYDGADVRYVREAAWQCCQNSSFVAITGESGSGKTTIVCDLKERILHDARQVIVIEPSVLGMEADDRRTGFRSTDILHAIITTLDPTRSVPSSLQARTVAAQKLLLASAQTGNSHLLLIEEAHGMPSATLRHLKRMHELRNGRRPLLGILLVAQPELRQRLQDGLRDSSLREVAQRCELVELLPLDGDLRAYMHTRVAAAGQKLEALFDPTGVEAIRERLTVRRGGAQGKAAAFSLCYPLAVNNLATRALNAAAELGVPVVNADVVRAA